MISCGSLKVKVGVYSTLITILALITGAAVVTPVVRYHQIRQLDEELENDAHELVRDLQNFRGAPIDPRRPLSAKLIPLALRGRYLIVEGPEGQTLYQSPNLRGKAITDEINGAETQQIFGRSCRIVTVREGPYVIRIGTRLGVIERFQKDLRLGFTIAVPFIGVVVFLGGLWLGRRAVAPVAAITAAAENISANHPDERLPIPRTKDEISRLTQVLNLTFDRLQVSYQTATRFSADASHQLKTPVTILRNDLDTLAATPGLSREQLEAIGSLRQQTRRLTALIEDLLLLAQVDAGRLQLEAESIDLYPLIAGAKDDLDVLLADRHITIETRLDPTLPARADERRIRLILQNLVENAANYTPDPGAIRIIGNTNGVSSTLIVENSGPLVPEEDRKTIFERFRRGKSVGENIRGYGLGLNIARELARAHGGDITYSPTEEGLNAFKLTLPAV